MDSFLNLFNFNAYRCSNLGRIEQFKEFLDDYNPAFVCIQEINVTSALKVFSMKYQVFINLEPGSNDGIGIVSLVLKGINVSDVIISQNGRIIGLKVMNVQLWNVYPKSGSGHKNARETFFRETLCNLMMQWKDSPNYVIESGDHNCIHRAADSLYNSAQHLQPGLIKHMQINGLSDEYLNIHGQDAIMFSRKTQVSKTRIDYVLSNTGKCSYFQYIDMNLGLDHCAMFARFDIVMSIHKEFIPKDRFFSGWVISRCLENDELFLQRCESIFKSIKNEFDCNTNVNFDPSFFWLKMKSAIISLAKDRERELYAKENKKIEVLKGFYSSILKDIMQGKDCFLELDSVKQQMDFIYQKRSREKIDKMRGLEIDNSVYDIHLLQNQRKYENQKKIKEIKIGENIYSGTKDVIKAIEEKMRIELGPHSNLDFDATITHEEQVFLSKLSKVALTDEEKADLLSPTTEIEISCILEHEVDKDSSPGEDGISYRFISIFWKLPEYRYLYLKFLNFTREDGSFGLIENFGVMTIKNKKVQSNLYEKKRKLTKVNKESNLGNGKVWTNRFKKIIIPKVLPQNQFNCQLDTNIIDEIREIRTVNTFLFGDEVSGQKDGSILSIDFKDAFRSISHRWFNLVMKHLGVPQPFIDWFWTMYKDLYVIIVLNKYKSDKIYVERGFMEGHPPSMAAFVVSLIPLMYSLQEKLTGIVTLNAKTHKLKMFADDLKLFIKDVGEIDQICEVIYHFEEISGLEMHRDPGRDKCQVLPFGNHVNFQNWPDWVSVKSKMKVVGGIFSNNECLDKLNSELVSKCFFNALQKAFGIRGTIFQKAYYVNTYLFSKLWFTAQCFKLDEKMLKNILSKSISFIYAGENEKPIRPLNFRNTSSGGLGLINPIIKARALFMKSMNKDFLDNNMSIVNSRLSGNLYGYQKDFIKVFENDLATSTSKIIYNFLVKEITFRNDSLIPSRNEKRLTNIKWGTVWKNFKLLKGLTPNEITFSWKVTQDMLPVGNRIHRNNAERRCLTTLIDGSICQEIQDLKHCFQLCPMVLEIYDAILVILNSFLGRNVGYSHLITYSFNHRSKQKLRCALWFAIKMMYFVYLRNSLNKEQLLKDLIKELDWNLRLNRKIGSAGEMVKLKDNILHFLRQS